MLLTLSELGAIRRTLGDLDGARAAHEQAWTTPVPDFPPFRELVAGELCADAALAGDWSRADEHARAALAVRMYEVLFAGFNRHLETEALLRAGDGDLAAADVRRFEER